MDISANGKLLDLDKPVVMGVINTNKDSFFSGSRSQAISDILMKAEKMIQDGASIIDIGGVSTRPGSVAPEVDEELAGAIPAIAAIRKAHPEVFISIDTYRAEVVSAAVAEGADIINDVSAGSMDAKMLDTVAASRLPYILMHMLGEPVTMQDQPNYEEVTLEILVWLKNKVYQLRNLGIIDIIIDPGFGFGKSIHHNYELLRNLSSLQILDCPILCGISRKSMLYKLLDTSPDEALNATTVANTLSLINGAKILRVHDVKPAIEAIKIYMAYNGQ